MYKITSTIYENYAEQIAERLTCNNSFFSGTLTVESEMATEGDEGAPLPITHRLRATIIVYREPYNPILRERGTGYDGNIRDIAAVWWEHDTSTLNGNQIEDDFDFELLKETIMRD
ncbi:MAG: hypothetical protein IKC42_01860 [Alistipes sp.]|nr:hypothetical protein [Alistipes sp.]